MSSSCVSLAIIALIQPHNSVSSIQRGDQGQTALHCAVRVQGRYHHSLFPDVVCHMLNITQLQGTQAWNWFAPSFLAVVVSVLVWWLAYNTKTKLQE